MHRNFLGQDYFLGGLSQIGTLICLFFFFFNGTSVLEFSFPDLGSHVFRDANCPTLITH